MIDGLYLEEDQGLRSAFVPGAGWIPFDPTNGSMGGFNLILVAVVRDIRQAVPVQGSFVGSNAFRDMIVDVHLTS